MSTPRTPPVKVTYLERSKRKRTRAGHEGALSDTNSSDLSKQTDKANGKGMRTFKQPATPASLKGKAKAKATAETSQSKVTAATPLTRAKSRDIDPRDAPGPTSSNRPVRSSAASVTATTRPTTLARTPSVVSVKSMNKKTPSSQSAPKPHSSATRANQSVADGRTIAGDEDDDESDADSIAESIKSLSVGRINRTVKDRHAYFSNQPDCDTFGPYRALCSRCIQYVNLNRKQTYAVAPWEKHRSKCDQEPASDAPFPVDAEAQVNLSVTEIFGSEPTSHVRRTTSARRAYLEAEMHAGAVEEDRVWCNKCQQWVLLKKGTQYDLKKWNAHRERCDRDERRRRREPHESSSKAGSRTPPIEVSTSSQSLESEVSSKAPEEVKEGLVPRADPPIKFPVVESSKDKAKRILSPTDPLTEVKESAHASRPLKRTRDDEEQSPSTEDGRPTNRPRPAAEGDTVSDAESALGWFLLPFHSFVRGFKESLSQDDR